MKYQYTHLHYLYTTARQIIPYISFPIHFLIFELHVYKLFSVSFLLLIFLPWKHICIIHINMQRLLDTTFKKHFILRCTLSGIEIFLLVFKFPKKIRFYDEQEITLRLKFHFLKNSSPELDIKIKAFTKVNVYEFLLKLTHTQTLHTPNSYIKGGI